MFHPAGFHTVRVLCNACGWFRNIAHSGCAEGRRAIVAIELSQDPTHVLKAKVVEVPENRPLAEVLAAHPGYRDLVHEAHENGLIRTLNTFDVLLADKVCPRCEVEGKMTAGQILELGKHVRY
jgi:hypothetical protein